MKTLVIIPAFNEEANIEKLSKKTAELGYDFLVINDASTDETGRLLDEHCLPHLDLVNNIGLAGVTQVGFKYALDHHYDAAIVIDGDGQHPPVYIQKVLKKIEEGYDYVVGSRYVEEEKPWTMRMLGSRLLCLCIFIKTGKKVSDPTSGMRALGKNVLKEFNGKMNFIAEPDALTHILIKGYKTAEVQVEMKEREAGVSYFRNPMKAIKFMFSTICSILFIQ